MWKFRQGESCHEKNHFSNPQLTRFHEVVILQEGDMMEAVVHEGYIEGSLSASSVQEVTVTRILDKWKLIS